MRKSRPARPTRITPPPDLHTEGTPHPIIHFQNVGYLLGDVAAKIEACRYFCWETAHYIDEHGYHGELIGAMNKTYCTSARRRSSR